MPDGDITLAVTLTTKDIKAKSAEIRNQVQQMFNGVSAGKLDKNLQKAYIQMDKLVSKSDSIIAKMHEMETTKIKNPEIQKTEKELDNLYKTISNIGYVTQGGSVVPFLESDREKANALQKELDDLKAILDELMQNGSQVSLMEVDPERYQAYASALNECNNELTVTAARAQQAGESVAQTGTSFSQVYHIVRTVVASIQTAFRSISSSVKKFGSHVKSIFNSAIRSAQKLASFLRGTLTSAFKKVSGTSGDAFSSKGLKKALNLVLKYGFGVRSLYFAFRKLRTAVKEGMENLVQYESETNLTNQRISEMNTSLLYLKNAWASAFAPVINVVLPILNTLIDRFAEVGNAIARFIGALTGQEIVLNAVKVDAGDYADSLDKTKKSAGGASDKVKKLTDRLASFDDLNVLGKDNDDDASGGGGSGIEDYMPDVSDMFEYVDAINEFGQKLKDAWKNQDWHGIGRIVADKIDESIVKPIIETLDWDNCKDAVMGFISQWGSVINGFLKTTALFDDIGTAIGKGITTISNTITHALRTLSLSTLGDDIYRVFKNAVENTDEKAIADAISEVFLAPIRIANGFFDGKDSKEVSDLFTEIGTKIANTANDIKWYDIFMGIFNFGSSIGDAIIDTITGFVNSGGFSGMLTQIANAINDAVNRLKPEDFEAFGKAIGSLIVSVLSDLNTFMDDTSDSFNTIIDGIGDTLANLPWEDIFKNAGEIAVKIINAIIKVLNVVGEHMNDIQENGKTLAQNIGETIGECISQIDFEGMGETFGLIAEGIIDGIISALENSDKDGIAGIIGRLAEGFDNADADTFETIASLAIWGTIAKAMVAGITRALPVIIANSPQISSALSSGLSKISSAGVGGVAKGAAGGLWNVGAAGVGIGGAITTVVGLVDALRMMNGEIDETDFGGFNTEVDTFTEGLTNAFSSLDQFRLTFALGMEGMGEIVAQMIGDIVSFFDTVGEKFTEFGTNVASVGDEIASKASEIWTNISETISTKFEEAKAFVEENIALFKENIALKWDEFKSKAEEIWTNIKETVTSKVEEFKSSAEEKIETLKTNLVNKWQEIKGSIYEKLVGIKTNIVEIFEQMKEAVKTPINGFLSIIEKMVNRVIEGVNLVADTFNTLPDVTLTNPFTGTDYTLGFSIPHLNYISIPRLAEGAVIPPNKEFMAVLGDQTSGTNIEAPLDTIKQAVAEEISAQMSVLENGFASVVSAIERKNLVIGDKEIGKANARYVNQQKLIRGTSI